MNVNKNTLGNDYIIGDLHGCIDLLKEKLEEAGFNKEKDRLFSVGDLIDRGPNSLDCLSLIYEPWFFAVRGNHEQTMFDLMKRDDRRVFDVLTMNGVDWTYERDLDSVKTIVEDAQKILPVYMTVDVGESRVGIVHAEPPNDWNMIDSYSVEKMLSSRDRYSDGLETPVKNIDRVYVGHSPASDPFNLGNVRYIDTYAFSSGNLTMEKLEAFDD